MVRTLLGALCAFALIALMAPLAFPTAQAVAPTFPDVPPDARYADAVQQLVARGVIQGYADGRFGPGDTLLRAQAAATIVRAMGLSNHVPTGDFNDRSGINDELWTSVRILADRGVARGFPDGSFQPNGRLTRQQAISFISRAMVALDLWRPQAATVPYGDVAPTHLADIATYDYYVDEIPQAVSGAGGTRVLGANDAAARGWYAETLWLAVKQDRGRANLSPAPSPSPTPPPPASPKPGAGAAASAPPPPSTSSYRFGTLLSDARNAPQLYAAGVRVVHLELGWDAYEPQDGVFDAAYAAAARQKVQSFRAAGLEVVLGVGLQYPPGWAYALPNSRYVSQHGTAAGPLNLTFNQALRLKAEAYIARVHQDLGLNTFSAVRIGSGGLVEALYPAEDAGGQANGYWAYDANAQGGANRPPTIPASPYPGWRPGQTTYNGQAFTTAQVQRWYDWYLGALVDGINWQIGLYKRLGYTGYEQVLLPGLGSRPGEYSTAIASYLNGGGDPNHTMGRGAVWHKVIEGLSDRRNVVVYISSLADGSGGNDVCQAGDAGIGLTDPRVNNWSATRWISYLANRYGMAKNGENPGRGDTNSYGTAMLQAAAAQMQGCGLQGMMWAHEANLYDRVSGVALGDYANVILTYR